MSKVDLFCCSRTVESFFMDIAATIIASVLAMIIVGGLRVLIQKIVSLPFRREFRTISMFLLLRVAILIAVLLGGNYIGASQAHGAVFREPLVQDIEKDASPADKEAHLRLRDHDATVTCICFSADGRFLATAGGKVRIWEMPSGKNILTLESGTHVAFDPKNERILTASRDRVVLWDSKNGKELVTKKGIDHTVAAVAFAPDGSRYAVLYEDGFLKSWDAKTAKELVSLPGRDVIGSTTKTRTSNRFMSMAYSPNCQWLAVMDCGSGLRVCNALTGKIEAVHEVSTLPAPGKRTPPGPRSVVFRPDSKQMLVGTDDGFLRVWDPKTGREHSTIHLDQGPVDSLALPRDGEWVVAGGFRDVRVVRLPDGGCMFSSKVRNLTHKGLVACTADGQWFAALHENREVRVWSVTALDKQAVAAKLKSKPHVVLLLPSDLKGSANEFPANLEFIRADPTDKLGCPTQVLIGSSVTEAFDRHQSSKFVLQVHRIGTIAAPLGPQIGVTYSLHYRPNASSPVQVLVKSTAVIVARAGGPSKGTLVQFKQFLAEDVANALAPKVIAAKGYPATNRGVPTGATQFVFSSKPTRTDDGAIVEVDVHNKLGLSVVLAKMEFGPPILNGSFSGSYETKQQPQIEAGEKTRLTMKLPDGANLREALVVWPKWIFLITPNEKSDP